MLAALIPFFTSSLGKYVAIFLAILGILAGAYGYLKLKEHDAAEAALVSFNAAQLAEVQKENADLQKQLSDLQNYAVTLAQDNDAKQKALDDQLANVNKVIDNSSKVQRATQIPLDPIFNNVLKELKK